MNKVTRKRLELAVDVTCVVAVAVVMIAGFDDDSNGEYVIVALIMASLWIWSWYSTHAKRRDSPSHPPDSADTTPHDVRYYSRPVPITPYPTIEILAYVDVPLTHVSTVGGFPVHRVCRYTKNGEFMKRRTFVGGIALGGAVAAMPGLAYAALPADDLTTIAGLVQEYFSGRALRVTRGGASAGPVDLAVPSTRSFSQRQRSDHEQLKYRRAFFERFGGYDRDGTTTTVLWVTGDASRPLARVREDTRLYFMKPRACGGKFTAYTVEHDVQFARDGGQLRLESAQFISSDYRDLPETQFLDAVPAKFRGDGPAKGSGIRPGTGEPPRSPKVVAGSTFGGQASPNLLASYDYGRMIEYAIRYGVNYNPNALKYADDCTAFISQCMNYGFWTHVGSWPGSDRTSNSNWFSGSYTWTTSYTWAGAENWYWFATGSGRTYMLDYLDYMVPSDVLQWNWPKGNPPDDILDHTQICTDIYYDENYNLGDQYMTQHSSGGVNYINRSLNYILSYQTWTYLLYAHRT